jgi:hypothetical protein
VSAILFGGDGHTPHTKKNMDLNTVEQITILMFTHNHRNWKTLSPSGCGSIGAVKGTRCLEAWTNNENGNDDPFDGHCLLISTPILDVHTLEFS